MFAGKHREANQIKQRRDQRLEEANGVFDNSLKAEPEPVIDVKYLHSKIALLALENVFVRCARQGGLSVSEKG